MSGSSVPIRRVEEGPPQGLDHRKREIYGEIHVLISKQLGGLSVDVPGTDATYLEEVDGLER